MRHEIETWAESESPAARLAMQNIAVRVMGEFAACRIEVDRKEPFMKLIIIGHGAALRAVVSALTEAEFL